MCKNGLEQSGAKLKVVRSWGGKVEADKDIIDQLWERLVNCDWLCLSFNYLLYRLRFWFAYIGPPDIRDN